MGVYTLTIEALRELSPAAYEWTFFLYTAKKSKDGPELTVGRCAMTDIAGWAETLRTTLLQKTLAEKTVAEYSPFHPKEVAGAAERTDPLLAEPLTNLLFEIRHTEEFAPEDFTTGVMPRPNGYGFYGVRRDDEGQIADEVLFIKRSNPFVAATGGRLCLGGASGVVDSDRPVLKFAPGTDFLLAGGIGCFLTPAVEKDFGLDSRYTAICEKRMRDIADAGIVSNYETLEEAAFLAKNARKFLEFDREILEYISRLPLVERGDFLLDYGITTDAAGLIDTGDPEQCELVIDLLCCRSCKDPLGRLAVGSITPRM